jgi:hypothetical protein
VHSHEVRLQRLRHAHDCIAFRARFGLELASQRNAPSAHLARGFISSPACGRAVPGKHVDLLREKTTNVADDACALRSTGGLDEQAQAGPHLASAMEDSGLSVAAQPADQRRRWQAGEAKVDAPQERRSQEYVTGDVHVGDLGHDGFSPVGRGRPCEHRHLSLNASLSKRTRQTERRGLEGTLDAVTAQVEDSDRVPFMNTASNTAGCQALMSAVGSLSRQHRRMHGVRWSFPTG